MAQPYVFMGGTFDPVHNGHLRTALELQQWLQVARVHLIPSGAPVHRDSPGCTADERLAMLQLATDDEPALTVDAREVESDKASYTLFTLESLRAELGADTPIVMIMGMDAYQTLPSWYEWRAFIDYCHILVVARPGYRPDPSPELAELTEKHLATTPEQLWQTAAGSIVFHELTPLGISATQVRDLIATGASPRYLLPDPVWHYIQSHHLYGLTS
ncbi:nicotinate-nucleotide adenylyltransferase [Neptuniibacter sp. CAU 1671]|uniref:nicotinate-nucleotide adenylyltransferase n=1 Tax=Neptuniibacter sp. CAU 1671 TaxID=3032593 RepID=UPI0023DB7561|nr:nicotinate-nucleotide adenylyltransferase [Neptuniibacter sp. CAU 1671]MDF2181712.1 nicotinate-nucleotide adenylyltransferase [Neptuniibacter sp. CAU 1671]